MKVLINVLIILYIFCLNAEAQLNDDFSDGDLVNTTQWGGDLNHFEVNSSKILHLKSTGADTSILTTASKIIRDTEFSFYVKHSFNSSDNNFSRIYLAASSSMLNKNNNAYFVQIGSSKDNISFWRQDGTILTELISGVVAKTDNSVNEYNIKVLCNKEGLWQLYSSEVDHVNYKLEGEVKDTTYTNSKYFGIYCKYTSSNSTKFYFDNFFVGPIIYDTIAPKPINIDFIPPNSIQITFNETIDIKTSENPLNYIVNDGIGSPLLAKRRINDSSIVDLLFSNSFTYNHLYTIQIIDIEDNNGNSMNLINIPFKWYNLKSGDVLINEIMADPNPAIDLPEVEYVEIFNNSGIDINLKNWILRIGNTDKVIPSTKVSADSFLIIGHQKDESLLSRYGDFVGFSSFSLTNTGTSILLKTDSNILMHYINYNTEWYHDKSKEEGGWSLEQIDPNNYCSGVDNWIASKSKSGGTPGKTNSQDSDNPDIDPPFIKSITIHSPTNIQIIFSETVDIKTATEPQSYYISDGIGSPINIVENYPEYRTFDLLLSKQLRHGQIYKISVSTKIEDCSGNRNTREQIAFLGIAQTVDSNDIIINEILFNPKYDGEDYIEIYNKSDKILDLKDLKLANRDFENQTWDNVKTITDESFLLLPDNHYILTVSASMVASQYYIENPKNIIEIASMPTMNNSSGNIFLINKSFDMIDGVIYSEDMHYKLLNNTEGISLERLSFTNSSLDASNWHSSAVPGKNNGDFGGTPTYTNSQKLISTDKSSTWVRSPEIFSPDNDGYEDFLQIEYQLKRPGYSANINIYDAKGREIRNICNNQLLETQGNFIWDGLDNNNNKAHIGIYIIFIEMYSPEGDTEHFKLSCVLGGKI